MFQQTVLMINLKAWSEIVFAKLQGETLFGICRLESHAVTELQICDVLVGAVAYAHKMTAGSVSTKGAKAQLVRYLQSKLNVYSLAQDLNLHLRNGLMFCVTQKLEDKKIK